MTTKFEPNKFYKTHGTGLVILITNKDLAVIVDGDKWTCPGEAWNISALYAPIWDEVEPQNMTFVPASPKPGDFKVGDRVMIVDDNPGEFGRVVKIDLNGFTNVPNILGVIWDNKPGVVEKIIDRTLFIKA